MLPVHKDLVKSASRDKKIKLVRADDRKLVKWREEQENKSERGRRWKKVVKVEGRVFISQRNRAGRGISRL